MTKESLQSQIAESTEILLAGEYLIQTHKHPHGAYELTLTENSTNNKWVMSAPSFKYRSDAIIYAQGYIAALRNQTNNNQGD